MDLGPGLSVLGGLFLLFMLENVLGLVRHRGLRPVSDTFSTAAKPRVLAEPGAGQHVFLGLGLLGQNCTGLVR